MMAAKDSAEKRQTRHPGLVRAPADGYQRYDVTMIALFRFYARYHGQTNIERSRNVRKRAESARSGLKRASTCQGAAQSDIICVFEVAACGQSGCRSRDAYAQWNQHAMQD